MNINSITYYIGPLTLDILSIDKRYNGKSHYVDGFECLCGKEMRQGEPSFVVIINKGWIEPFCCEECYSKWLEENPKYQLISCGDLHHE